MLLIVTASSVRCVRLIGVRRIRYSVLYQAISVCL